MVIASVNPATGETLRSFEPMSRSEVDRRIALAESAFRQHRRTSFDERRRWLSAAADILEREKQEFGRLMVLEMGKPIQAAVDEASKCATACRYYVENGERILSGREIATAAKRSFVLCQPLGVVLAVMPWNFPFWQVFRFAAPALMAGNAGLLKHASNVPQCALAIEDIWRRAGVPEGLFQALLVGSSEVERILDDPRVAAATLTGSESAGSQVAQQAGRRIKKTVLELGGSDPFIVMPSADVEQALATAVRARMINNGQSCIAAKRFIVAAGIYEEFLQKFVSAVKSLLVGDPMNSTTQVGPLATAKIVEELEHQVNRAVAAGARVETGGSRIAGAGNYFEPTVLTGVLRDSAVYREEMFGPVAMVFPAEGIGEAIEIANDTPFGLGASAWTRDDQEAGRFMDELEAGMVFINGMVASDARLPFGGVKRSGYGRELSAEGILEFVNIKTVWVGQS